MKLKVFVFGAIALGVAAVSSAQSTAYAVDVAQNLYFVDLPTGNAQLIGATNSGGFLEALAISPTGLLVGADTGGNLYSISTSTGAATLIGSTGIGAIEGLDYAGSTLFAFDFAATPTLYTINDTNAASSLFVTSNTNTGAVRGFAFNPGFTVANMITDSPSFQSLHGMVPSGVTTHVGPLNQANLVAAVDFDMNTGVFWGLDSVGNVGTINTTTGLWTTTGNNTGGQFWLGMATAVPEPGSMIALGAGLVALAARRRKKAKA